jgi:hypothetical protein
LPSKRQRVGRNIGAHRITPAAVAAFLAGDYRALHHELNLRPWQTSPLPLEVSPLGCDDGEPFNDGEQHRADWENAQQLQRELIAAVRATGRNWPATLAKMVAAAEAAESDHGHR